MAVDSGHGEFRKAHLVGWIPEVTNDAPRFDPLTTSASALLDMLTEGNITSVQILYEYYRQILKYNGYLKAVYRLMPSALDRAKQLDAQRASGGPIGSLHGIPILLKDNVGTEPGMEMDNTGGNIALVGSTVLKNAPIVDRLLDAGAIILGKATLSQMMWFKGTGIRCGWSALHGHSPNPYVKGGLDMSDGLGGHSSPGGSSSGSGIAVAAGFAPMAIGTETEGSLITPSTRQSLYTIKPALGSVPNAGIIPVSYQLDVAGPMCLSVHDTAVLLTVLQGNDSSNMPAGGYTSAMKGEAGWQEIRIGAVDPERFRYNDPAFQTPIPEALDQIRSLTLNSYDRLKELASNFHYDVDLRSGEDFDLEGANSLVELMVADFEHDFDKYLSGTKDSKVLTTKELAEWNKVHSDLELPPAYPNQDFIVKSVAFDHTSDRRQILANHIETVGQSLPDTLNKYDVNVIIGPGDGQWSKFSAATGYPLCSLPLGTIGYNGRPVGLMAMAKSEATLVTLMSAFEVSFDQRKPPTAFLSHGDEE